MIKSKLMVTDLSTYKDALDDFRRERSHAALRRFWSGLTGRNLDLLRFDEISNRLYATTKADRGLQNIPVKDIVGSVGRYQDFDRDFLPLLDNDMHRWAGVKTAMISKSSGGLPPISVYKLGDAYFVLDGNHRVSIAKQMGFEEIEAYVTEFKTKGTFTPGMTPSQLIIEQEYLDFLKDTGIDDILPGVNLKLTSTVLYGLLKEHINVHRYYMGIEQSHEPPYAEAVEHWYVTVYQPVVGLLRDLGVMREFPDSSETDLYLWVLDHQSRLQEEYALPVRTDVAAGDLALQEGKRLPALENRAVQQVDSILARPLTGGSSNVEGSPKTLFPPEDALFQDILVAINGQEEGWSGLDQAVIFRNLVGGRIWGLHITSEDQVSEAQRTALEERFSAAIAPSSDPGKIFISSGEITPIILSHARLTDLLVLRLMYPPSASVFDRFSSGFISIASKINKPILVVGKEITAMDKCLLAFDGSTQSKEALYIASYLAARWNNRLHVVTVDDGSPDLPAAVASARTYLKKLGIDFEYYLKQGKVADQIFDLINQLDINCLFLGGYKSSAFVTSLFGSTVDPLLRNLTIPILLCH